MAAGELLYISQYFQWHNDTIMLNGNTLFEPDGATSLDRCADFYRKATISYPKFFKMDLLSKVAYLSAATVLPKDLPEDKTKVAVVLSSGSGCIDVDKKFEAGRAAIASPALFVYTLPNIMLGEICIANGFKGEQMCTLTDKPDAGWFDFYIHDLIRNRGTAAALCGHVEATEQGIDAVLLWVHTQPHGIPFDLQHLSTIFNYQ